MHELRRDAGVLRSVTIGLRRHLPDSLIVRTVLREWVISGCCITPPRLVVVSQADLAKPAAQQLSAVYGEVGGACHCSSDDNRWQRSLQNFSYAHDGVHARSAIEMIVSEKDVGLKPHLLHESQR